MMKTVYRFGLLLRSSEKAKIKFLGRQEIFPGQRIKIG
jgi:hypothetical protein